jgi:putative transposase
MADLLPLRPHVDTALAEAREKSRSKQPEWLQLRDDQREAAFARMAVLTPVIELMQEGHKARAAIRHIASLVAAGNMSAQYLATFEQARSPSAKSLQNWLADYMEKGIVGLAPAWNGRPRKEGGWEGILLQRLKRPPLQLPATHAEALRNMGFADATNSRVRRFINALPADQREFSSALVGEHFRRQNLTPHVRRDHRSVAPGFLWEGDGHTLDWYTAHHNSGHKHRYELTQWLDIGTDFVVGWWLSEAESALNTHFSLGDAIRRHDHVPAVIHVDPGPGFKNRLMIDEVSGMAARIGFEMDIAIAGNARGKGNTEGSFRWLEERVGKEIGREFGTYVGKGMPQELCRRIDQRIKSGEARLPVFEETYAVLKGYYHRRNNTPRDFLDGRTPAEAFAEREANPLYLPPDVLAKPAERCKAHKYEVRLFNRWYRHAALSQWEGETVVVQYDLHNDAQVSVLAPDGRFICIAELQRKKDWYSPSRMHDIKQNSVEGQRKRKQRALDEIDAKARTPLTLEATVTALADPQAELPPPPSCTPVSDAAVDLVAREIAARAEVPETAEERFALWQSLCGRTDLDPALLNWVLAYESTSECRVRLQVMDELGDNNRQGETV